MMLYIRRRELLSGSFIEFYVWHNAKFLTLPMSPLERFQNRLLQPPFNIDGIIVCAVDSKPQIQKRTYEDIFKDGAWISYNDTTMRGSWMDTVTSRAVFFGIPIDPELNKILYNSLLKIYAAMSLWQVSVENEPFVMYHGTARESVKSILATGFLKTFGMLGNAIYFGTFWKSFRFATMTQDYKKRRGTVLRCYCISKKLPLIKTDFSEKCKCSDCISKNGGILCDHEAKWSLVADYVIACASHTIKNEEYAVKDNSMIIIDSYGHVECRTEHHEPLKRDTHID